MLLRAVRWGLAGVLVAWTLLRLLGLDLGWPIVPLLASAFDAKTLATVDWLSRRHGLEISCYVLTVFRFGNERLLSIRREYPARDAAHADPAAEVQRLLTGVATNGHDESNGHSTPPPAL